MLLLAAFSRSEEVLGWARRAGIDRFGPVALESEAFSFTETAYYAASMGTPLVKRFFAFERLIDPGELAAIKRLTNGWENQCAAEFHGSEQVGAPRPLNLDPGYIDLGKLVLASTKDHAHRIYLGQGIYAEVTLQYRAEGGWQPQPWTFPDYRRADYQAFFDCCRELLRQRLRTQTQDRPTENGAPA